MCVCGGGGIKTGALLYETKGKKSRRGTIINFES